MLQTIKTLREKSGAGMVACKKALDESGGDIDKALELLRKQGIAKASKRGDRDASEGVIKIDTNEANNTGYILKINSETDFVARNDKFQDFADKILNIVKDKEPRDKDELLAIAMEDGHSVQENIESLSGVIGEKLIISEYNIMKSSGTVAGYSHAGGRIGALVSIDKVDSSDLARDIAMHVAAADPKYLNTEDVLQDEIDKEKEIYKEQLIKEGKPENIIEKILEGKIDKYFGEVCLIKQEYIKDDKQKVENVLNGVKIEKFVRYSL